MFDAMVAGHLCLDIIPEIPAALADDPGQLIEPGRLVEVGGAVLSTGGAVSNTGLALSRLGLDVRLVARVGNDAIAELTRSILERHGSQLGRDLRVASGEPSSYTIALSPPGRDRTFLHCPGTNNTFGPEDISPDLLAQTRLFHFGYPPLMRRMFVDGGQELTEILRLAKAAGATTSLDMALPDSSRLSGRADWRGILRRALPFVDVFAPSAQELCYMLDRGTYEALQSQGGGGALVGLLSPDAVARLGKEALALGAAVVLIKTGDRGAYLCTGERLADLGRGAPTDLDSWRSRELWAPCFRVHVVSTVGAGDATVAGFLAGMLYNQGPEEALLSAVAVGACNVEAADATSGIRPWKDTQARIARGWDRLEARVKGTGWRWDAKAGLYHGPDDIGGISEDI